MKKNIEKILASASIIIAVVLIIILLVTAFDGIDVKEFDNSLVRGLFITLGILYLALAGGQLAMLFLSNDAVKEIVIRSEQGGNCKATIGVVRKLVKNSCADIEGVKCGKVALIVNEYGVRLKVSVKVTGRDVAETETYIRTQLEEMFMGALGFRFHAIEIKITHLAPRFAPDKEKVEAAVAEKLAAEAEIASGVDNTAEGTDEIVPETEYTLPVLDDDEIKTDAAPAREEDIEEGGDRLLKDENGAEETDDNAAEYSVGENNDEGIVK